MLSHHCALAALRLGQSNNYTLNLQKKLWHSPVPSLPIKIFGRELKHPVGLAAGYDKDAVALKSLAAMGFSFIEAGTVTPKPQAGNPDKKILRIVKDQALVNSLGFNSKGLIKFRKQLQQLDGDSRSFMLGVNIGKNTTTPLEKAVNDYEIGLEGVYDFADYVVLNLSSPNSPGLRELQTENHLCKLLSAMLSKRSELVERTGGRFVPISIKLSPDLNIGQVREIADILKQYKVDAIIATNTTLERPKYSTRPHPNYKLKGGLSGKPLCRLSTEVIRSLANATNHSIPIIGVGGISTAEDAWEKMRAGATLVQIYTSLIYSGPKVISEIVSGLKKYGAEYSPDSFAEAQALARKSRR